MLRGMLQGVFRGNVIRRSRHADGTKPHNLVAFSLKHSPTGQ